MRSLLLLIFSLSISVSCLAQLEGTKFKDALISKNAKLHYIYAKSPGFSELSNGRMVGICVDIMADFEFFLLDRYNIKVEVIENLTSFSDFPKFQKEIENASFGVFGLANTTLTEEREERFNFSPPFIRNYPVMLTHQSVEELFDMDSISKSFSHLTAITVPNSTNHHQLLNIKQDYFLSMEIEFVDSYDTLMSLVSKNEGYFTIVDMIYMVEARKNKLAVKEHSVGVQKIEEFAVILPKNTDWDIPLRKFLTDEYKSSLSYRKIITRHLGRETLMWLDEMDALYAVYGQK